MISRNAYATASPAQATFPVSIARTPKRNDRTGAFSSNTTSETIEIFERYGRQEKDLDRLASASLFAASAIMFCAALAVLLIKISGFLDTQIQFSMRDVLQVIAGR